MNDLRISVPSLSDPYRELVTRYLARTFPANLDVKDSILESLTTALVTTSRNRFGPAPGPESLVAIREVIRRSIERREPIPLLVPWGGKKPGNDSSVDVAELYGLRMMQCLQERVMPFYAPGLAVNIRIEDTGALYLFADEGEPMRAAVEQYSEDFVQLVRVLGLNYIQPIRESRLMNLTEYARLSEEIRTPMEQYIIETDAYGFDGYKDLESWKALSGIYGWQGIIPTEQRDFYRQRYAKLYGGTVREQTDRLSAYLAGSLARYKLKATAADEKWGGQFITLSFVPPIPGMPATMGDRRLYYRTMPENMTRNHIPAWRARGYLRIVGNEVTPKIANWGEELNLDPCVVEFSNAGETVAVRADRQVIAEN